MTDQSSPNTQVLQDELAKSTRYLRGQAQATLGIPRFQIVWQPDDGASVPVITMALTDKDSEASGAPDEAVDQAAAMVLQGSVAALDAAATHGSHKVLAAGPRLADVQQHMVDFLENYGSSLYTAAAGDRLPRDYVEVCRRLGGLVFEYDTPLNLLVSSQGCLKESGAHPTAADYIEAWKEHLESDTFAVTDAERRSKGYEPLSANAQDTVMRHLRDAFAAAFANMSDQAARSERILALSGVPTIFAHGNAEMAGPRRRPKVG